MNRKLHQPDINGTHTPLDTPLSEETQAVFKAWMDLGHLLAPNTSYTIKKIAKNVAGLANSPYITELGVAVHETDADTPVIYHELSEAERETIAGVMATDASEHIQTAAFFPKHEAGDSHGMMVYVNPEITGADTQKLLARHFAIQQQTTNAEEFAGWVKDSGKPFGMVEWKPKAGFIPPELAALNLSYDSGGTYFVTPAGINKATTFLELLALRYPDIPASDISIAGDSGPTDGPLFAIPDITHIAVGDKSLLQDVSGSNFFAETPAEANEMLAELGPVPIYRLRASTRVF
jgi:hydroxymethylpyrimidine pyrophosphatase-like HAD family hydrolase